jgi:flavin reductase (DIM6/NTAB) family NADH-FMN oxidoreductase RutF
VHTVIEPRILYFGTPVVLISTMNEDGTPNLAPMSSAWWLSDSCMLGMAGRSQTMRNLLREGECVLNLPDAGLVEAVDRLALTTGRNPVPDYKARKGYRYEPDKFGIAGLSPLSADLVRSPRVAECPVNLEAVVTRAHDFGTADDYLKTVEVHIVRVHIEESLVMADSKRHIDPERWNPLIMNFCEFYGLSEQIHSSRLAKIFSPQFDAVPGR